MKVINYRIFVFVLAIAALSGCSSDSDSSGSENLQLAKMIFTDYSSGTAEAYPALTFTYSAGRLEQMQQQEVLMDFIYEGDKVTEFRSYDDGDLLSTTAIFYNGDKISYTLAGDAMDEKTEYDYIGNNLSEARSGYIFNGEFNVLETINYSFDNNSNMVEKITNMSNGGFDFSSRQTYTYDSKNNPAKILNPVARLLFQNSEFGFEPFSMNNVLTRNYYETATDATPSEAYTYNITYNAQDYPTEIKQYRMGGELRSVTTLEYQ